MAREVAVLIGAVCVVRGVVVRVSVVRLERRIGPPVRSGPTLSSRQIYASSRPD